MVVMAPVAVVRIAVILIVFLLCSLLIQLSLLGYPRKALRRFPHI